MLPTTATAVAARRLAASSATNSLLSSSRAVITSSAATAVAARRTYATPMGPPPKGFRQPAPRKWDEDSEGTFDKLGKYFLMTEMARGMYVLLEQFVRPP